MLEGGSLLGLSSILLIKELFESSEKLYVTIEKARDISSRSGETKCLRDS